MCAPDLTARAGIKPSDRYSVPLCSSCHALQHQFGELTFWSTLRIDPLNVAFRLWTHIGRYQGRRADRLPGAAAD